MFKIAQEQANKGQSFFESLALALSPQLANESKPFPVAQKEERLREREREAAILGGVDEATKKAKQYGRLYLFFFQGHEFYKKTTSRCSYNRSVFYEF